jgi:hypothetical protein
MDFGDTIIRYGEYKVPAPAVNNPIFTRELRHIITFNFRRALDSVRMMASEFIARISNPTRQRGDCYPFYRKHH